MVSPSTTPFALRVKRPNRCNVEASNPLIKVTSPSFSRHPDLVRSLRDHFPRAVVNSDGIRFQGEALQDYLADADGAIIGLERVDVPLLDACPKLRIVAKFGVGLDAIDLKACKARGVTIGWRGGVNRRSVSELVLSFMLGLARNSFQTARLMRQGEWRKEGGFQLTGKTVGIIGVGHVGKDLVQLLKPFDCRILGNDILDMNEFYQEHGVIEAEKAEIYTRSDLISLHVPATPLTHHLMDASVFKSMKSSAFLINTSRGEVVEQQALKRALMNRQIAGAAIDVYQSEPPNDKEFLTLPNLVCTPHIGGNANEAVLAMGRSAIDFLDAYFGATSV
ncbi:MAG: phosphoglycerate dehydrogenase [Magnetococcales bacterium]|nr:phosphoglycerate dehydrogenase [Magnetococcales bacterium]